MKKGVLTVLLCSLAVCAFAQIQGDLQTGLANRFVSPAKRAAVLKAVKENNLAALKKAVGNEKGAAYVSDDNGMTALMHACRNSNLAMVKYLLDKGAKVNTEQDLSNGEKGSALFYALDSKPITDLLLKHNAHATRHVVLRAIRLRKPTALTVMDAMGAIGISAANSGHGNAYLSAAANSNNVAAAQKALELGADLNRCDFRSTCHLVQAIEWAREHASQGVDNTVFAVFTADKTLTAQNANYMLWDVVSTCGSSPAFTQAAVKKLVAGFSATHTAQERKAMVSMKNADGDTAESLARRWGAVDVANFLRAL